jgi:hypothetical protein
MPRRADFVRFMKFGATARAVLGIIDREVDLSTFRV